MVAVEVANSKRNDVLQLELFSKTQTVLRKITTQRACILVTLLLKNRGIYDGLTNGSMARNCPIREDLRVANEE